MVLLYNIISLLVSSSKWTIFKFDLWSSDGPLSDWLDENQDWDQRNSNYADKSEIEKWYPKWKTPLHHQI